MASCSTGRSTRLTIVRRTKFRLEKARERLHILNGYLKALDALDEVIALIRRSPTVEDAHVGYGVLDIDEVQADAILALQPSSGGFGTSEDFGRSQRAVGSRS